MRQSELPRPIKIGPLIRESGKEFRLSDEVRVTNEGVRIGRTKIFILGINPVTVE